MTPNEIEIERLKIERERLELERHRANFELYRGKVEAHRMGVEAVIKFAEIAIRSLLILNGGAALAMLSFASSAASRDVPVPFRSAVLVFGLGAALSVLTAGLSYITQSLLTEAESPAMQTAGNILRYVSVLCAFVSLGAFVAGTYLAVRAL